jgi:hypothetical protein
MPKSTPAPAKGEMSGHGREPKPRHIAITFKEPDVIYQIHKALLDTWREGPFLAIKDVGFFLRVVMPVRLTDGSIVDFGTWLEIIDEDFRTAWRTWNFPEYADLEVQGYVGNDIAPWGKIPHALVKAAVRDVEEIPCLISCEDPLITRILEAEWPPEEVLGPYAKVLRRRPKPAGSKGRVTAAKRTKHEPATGPLPEAG